MASGETERPRTTPDGPAPDGLVDSGLVVVGASHAGVQLAAAAREYGYPGPITLIGDEPDAPYQRPPLSKGFLAGKTSEPDLALRSDAFFAETGITLRPGTRAAAIDRAARRLHLADGTFLPYGHLALTTGARARPLPASFGEPPGGVLVLRDLADARRLREAAATARDVVVLGGGFIGLEVAAALASPAPDSPERRVTLAEGRPRLLARSASPELAEHVAARHRAAGVALHLGTAVDAIEQRDGRLAAVRLTDGTRLPADLLVVGIGVIPNTELAEAAGLACLDGIVVDRHARTEDPHILAAGDCTAHPSEFAGATIRLESIQNAQDQARTAAATIVGRAQPHIALPWFWSDQLGMKLQMAGLLDGTDRTVRREKPGGDGSDAKFSLWHFAGERLRAVETVNLPAEHMLSRRLLALADGPTPAQAADPGFDLRRLLKG
ncbi:FAD-dependent oxidoreductase [Roseomonas sp. NAR14]|uniref:FAD-dependent oxidoreductase n=1 Tax=Roseomonas acroporae TaxID=2937791 RepID=A0A9X1YAY2_9PROT|nr:FAD-dependent oxidoreductase [Roseomonas acroporae]MCK8783151.1 FAD-dependent oxidoreductase [Roseomonas acroporae]